jgi:hypothetical protein
MPTISQLPAATTIEADDTIPISQGGIARATAVGTLLAQTQPAIVVGSPSLLGRISLGPGGPEQVDVGAGLGLNSGTLAANGADHAGFSSEATLQLTDEIVINSGGIPKLLHASSLRTLFSPGPNIEINSSGVISASLPAGSAGEIVEAYSINTLPSAATIAAEDLVGVSQEGVDHSITYSGLLNGQTIDKAHPAEGAADTDTLWVAQGSATMVRQTLGALWVWIAGHAPSIRCSVAEIVVNTVLDPNAHNGRILVCSQPISISATAASLGNGFWCELINVSSGSVSLTEGISTPSGSSMVLPNQTASLRCITYSSGSLVYATISAAGGATGVPGSALNLTSTSVQATSITLSWQPPISGGAASAYTIQYRTSGTSAWVQAAQGQSSTSFTVTGLSLNSSYDFTVIASNSAGQGPTSNILTTTIVTNSAPLSVPGQMSAITVSANSSTTATVSWMAPSSGGAATSYTIQYRVTGSGNWSGFVSGVLTTSQAITGLSAGVSYDFSVYAVNSAGSGAVSGTVTCVTPQQGSTVTSITWNVPPSGPYVHGSGSIGVNVHVNPATAPVQFGFSTSATIAPPAWIAGVAVNTDLWGAYLPTPSTAGSWYAWVEGADGSCVTVYQPAFAVT